MSDDALIYREYVFDKPTTFKVVWLRLVELVKGCAQACATSRKPLRIIVTQDERARTLPQNRRYFGFVLKSIADQAWVEGKQHRHEVWHEFFAEMYCPRMEVTLPNGRILNRRKSTTEMTVGEFSDYVLQVEAYAARELGVRFELEEGHGY